MSIIIVGGGIGGLATAVALQHVGITATVYERTPEIREVGAGLTIWSNAMKALRRIGLENDALKLGSTLRHIHTYSPKGNLLSSMDFDSVSRSCDADSICIHRADLQRLLARQLNPAQIVTGHECVGVNTDSFPHQVCFADGSTVEGHVIIGADGLHSAIRRSLLGLEKPRYAGYYCYRAIAEGVELPDEEAHFCMLHGLQVGFFPFGRPGQTYWFVCPNAPQGQSRTDGTFNHREVLAALQDDLPPHLGNIIARTPMEHIIIGDIADRPPEKKWGTKGVTLLGDAAHPTTPNLGQGACMAIEDAIVLAEQLSEHSDPVKGLRHYEQIRYQRTTWITNTSRNLGKIYQYEHPFLVWLRTAMFRLPFADSIGRRTQQKILRYDPPEIGVQDVGKSAISHS